MDDLQRLKIILDNQVNRYNRKEFIVDDPISVPHQYSLRQDVEIAAFWTAMLSWGRRTTIIDKANALFELMDHSPYEFVTGHHERDRIRFEHFAHRTFQFTDTLYFLEFFSHHFNLHNSLEDAFLKKGVFDGTREALISFHNYFFSLPHVPERTRKHVPTPARKSSCKRLNMFLRWMVRKDPAGVDFGMWDRIPVNELRVPLDVHVEKVARRLGLLRRKQRDWQAVEELTERLRQLDPNDPVKYDFALFGMGLYN